MTKKLIWALVLIGASVIVLLVNMKGMKIEVDLIVTEVRAVRSMVFLAFTAIGVTIGLLLK